MAEEAGLPVAEIDVGAGTSAFRIAGVEAGWNSRQIGDVLRLVCDGRTANATMIINEVDKVGGGISSTSGTRSSMSDALLPLLEPSTASRFRCPASGLDCDMSRVIWIATANEPDRIDAVLRSRLEAIEVPALGREDLEQYVDLVIPEEDRGAVRRLLADLPVGPRLTLRHVRRLANRLRGAERQDMLH
jgi:ATP-dependent Lon protease